MTDKEGADTKCVNKPEKRVPVGRSRNPTATNTSSVKTTNKVIQKTQTSSSPSVPKILKTTKTKSCPNQRPQSQPVICPPEADIQESTIPKLTNYRCSNVKDLKSHYITLLNHNITHLIDFIYSHTDQVPYNSPEVRIALSMQMILSSEQLIPIDMSTKIARDFDVLRKDEKYTNQWDQPAQKRKRLLKELEMLKKHTEIDDSISLNIPDKDDQLIPDNIEDFDLHSSVSTLNVSLSCPIEDEDSRCLVM
jgi:hypothetical protein